MTYKKIFKDLNLPTMTNREKLEYLAKHERYDTMNSWNRATSYANNVKIYNLFPADTFTEKEEDLLWDILGGEVTAYELYAKIHMLICDFTENTGYTADFNGRSGGYLVLYEKNNLRGIGEDFDGLHVSKMTDEEVEDVIDEYENYVGQFDELVSAVNELDKLTEDIAENVVYFVKNATIDEIEEIHIRKEAHL